jgi:malate dehydrogenase (oxaloacetate-decarboxylating)(NADP+)
LGKKQRIQEVITQEQLQVSLDQLTVIDPESFANVDEYIKLLMKRRHRKGVTMANATHAMLQNRNYFGAAMVATGDADAMLSGITSNYPKVIQPALNLIDMVPNVHRISSLHMIMQNRKLYFFADTIVNVSPDARTLAEIALQTASFARELDIEPRIALLSYSNFGSSRNEETYKIAEAIRRIKELDPTLNVDGEMMVDFAINPELRQEFYPFSSLKGAANVFIFPELNSANIASRMMNRLGNAEKVGPILMGFSKSIHVLHRGCDMQDIMNIAAIAAMDARQKFGS